jgi:RNA polymerase sigma-70 factor (ECF subfamily)
VGGSISFSEKRPISRFRDDGLKQLIVRVRQGDQTALGSLYDQTSRLVYGLALRVLGDPEDAEEVTMDVYMQVWKRASDYDESRGSPIAWLLTLGRSRAIDRLRSSARARRQDDAFTVVEDTTTPHQDIEISERRRFVHQARATLSPEQREAIEIAYFSGLSHFEIADKLGQPVGTIKTRIRSGMIRLKRLLQPLLESQDGKV